MGIPIADGKVQMVCTSPPYYGLRDYGTAKWIGGNRDCSHSPRKQIEGCKTDTNKGALRDKPVQTCKKCGASRIDMQLGLEPTLEEYINNTVLWCREVKRVLRDDGVFFLNMGDSYNGSGAKDNQVNSPKQMTNRGGKSQRGTNDALFKPKDLMMVPHRVAIALQNDGWYVRSDIVWHKPNPMPESVTDRPTKSHEYIFLLTKSRKYFYDADAIREEHKPESEERYRYSLDGSYTPGEAYPNESREKPQSWKLNSAGRNKRSVWTITTKPYPGAHFATFPPEIPEICIKAGTSEKGVCPVCGAGWVREVETHYDDVSDLPKNHPQYRPHLTEIKYAEKQREREDGDGHGHPGHRKKLYKRNETIGWKPTCDHDEEPVPAIVLDPFAGSGTTVMVANALGRKGIGIDLSWDYLQLAKERTGQKALEEWQHGKKVEANWEDMPLFVSNCD